MDQVKTWKGRTAAVGAFTAEEWLDLFTILRGLDGFVDSVAAGLEGIERAHVMSPGLSAELATLRDLASSAQNLTPVLAVFMERFDLVENRGTMQ